MPSKKKPRPSQQDEELVKGTVFAAVMVLSCAPDLTRAFLRHVCTDPETLRVFRARSVSHREKEELAALVFSGSPNAKRAEMADLIAQWQSLLSAARKRLKEVEKAHAQEAAEG